MSCGVGHRRGSDPVRLWCRPAAAAPIQPLASERPYAAGVALKRQKKKVCREEHVRRREQNGNDPEAETVVKEQKEDWSEMGLRPWQSMSASVKIL